MNNTTGKKLCAALCAVLLSATLCACDPFGAYRKQLEQGRAQMQRGQYEAAVSAYTIAAEKNPRRADAYSGRADAYAALADNAKLYSTERSSYRRAALLDYKKAVELDNGELRRDALLNYYLRLGDEALAAAQDAAALTDAYSYDIAAGYYQSAMELDRANAAPYGRMVALLLAQDKTEDAAALLQRAMVLSNDPSLQRQLEALNGQIEEREENARRADALRVLRSVPYYGDPERCRMSAGQAVACAKLISDGLKGKFYGYTGYGKPLYDKPVYWDEPYPVVGYGSYETDRGGAILADLSGNGVPYLCLFSTLTDGNSFEIYGWLNGEMKLTAGEESWGGQQNGALTELADGSVVLVETVSMGGAAYSGQTFRFRDGAAMVTESWYEAREDGERVVRVSRDGVTLTYPRDQWEGGADGVAPERREASYPPLADVIAGACPLRDMISYLDAWAQAVSAGEAESVAPPPEYPVVHRMATAMLHQLFVLDHLAIDDGTRLCYVRLADCNGDGMDELIAAFSGAYRTADGFDCQFAIYQWRDGVLTEIPGGNRFNELWLARRKNTTSRGVLGLEVNGTLTRYAYTFLDGAEEFQADAVARKYAVIKNGQSAGIAESEYAALAGQYDTIERLVDFGQTGTDRNYERVVSSLYNMRS